MKPGALRRLVPTLLVYGVASWVVLGLSRWLRRVLALPGLFDTLVLGGLLLGVVFAALMAWFYPEVIAAQDQRARPRPPPAGP